MRQHELANQIYDLFDQKKIELADKASDFQRDVVIQFAKAVDVKLKSGYRLESTTSVIGPHKLQNILDRKAEHILQEAPNYVNCELAQRYLSEDISVFFEDLMLKSAERSGEPVPKSDRKTKSLLPITKKDGTWWVDPNPEYERTMVARDEPRSVRVSTSKNQKVLDLIDQYMKSANFGSSNTLNKVRRGVTVFAKVMGNPMVTEIQPRDLFKYIQAYVDSRPSQPAENTIRDYKWSMDRFLDWCVRYEFLDRNPFDAMKFQAKEFGRDGESRLPFTSTQLMQIFAQEIEKQERLLLSLLIVTGMRIDEAALLTWEQYQEIDGIRCFKLIGAKVKTR